MGKDSKRWSKKDSKDSKYGKKRKPEDEAGPSHDDDTITDDFEVIPGAASKNAEKNDEEIQEDEYGAKDYRLAYKTDSCD